MKETLSARRDIASAERLEQMPDTHEAAGAARVSERIPADVQRQILKAIAGIDYGSVEITIHGTRVVQIESRAKLRLAGEK
jgi:hypothetical protein